MLIFLDWFFVIFHATLTLFNVFVNDPLLGITEFWCSSPVTGGALVSIEEVRAENDAVLGAMKKFPGKRGGPVTAEG